MATAGNKHANLGKCNPSLIWRPKTATSEMAASVLHTPAADSAAELLLQQVEWHTAAAPSPPPPSSLPPATYKILKDYFD